jgi:hypothetical protein
MSHMSEEKSCSNLPRSEVTGDLEQKKNSVDNACMGGVNDPRVIHLTWHSTTAPLRRQKAEKTLKRKLFNAVMTSSHLTKASRTSRRTFALLIQLSAHAGKGNACWYKGIKRCTWSTICASPVPSRSKRPVPTIDKLDQDFDKTSWQDVLLEYVPSRKDPSRRSSQ